MHFPNSVRGKSVVAGIAIVAIGLLLVVALARNWHRAIAAAATRALERDAGAESVEHDDDHDDDHSGPNQSGHDHDHAGHDDANSIELSPEARRTLDLKTGEATVGTFVRRLSVPAAVVPWPGRTHVTIAAPLTGTVTAVHVAHGESIDSGSPLYTLRLTHQDLVRTQSDFLQTLGQADVERQEVRRLNDVAESGAIARRSLLERQYAFERLQAELRAKRESLLLHGLTEAQVQYIEQERKLIREITLFAPVLHEDRSLHDQVLEGFAAHSPTGPTELPASAAPPLSVPSQGNSAAYQGSVERAGHDDMEHIQAQFVVTELIAERGQSVSTGDPLTILADYEVLLAEGHAFQQDAEALAEAARTGAPIQAVFESGGSPRRVIDGLQIAYVGSEVRTDSRTLPFYVMLENERIREETRGQRRYTSWRYKPGQRLQLRVPAGRVDNVIVLPVDAVASEGAESYIFVQNGDHFDRRPVEVVLRDQLNIAIANSGAVFPGEMLALSDAHQLQMALKNSAGGGPDPHAGHSH